LLDVADAARAEADPVIGTWAERAIWGEAEAFLLGRNPSREIGVGDAWERAQRKMRSAGYDACPTCRSRIAGWDELAQMQQRRQQRIHELETHERAVDG
jgi:hypothetical protein